MRLCLQHCLPLRICFVAGKTTKATHNPQLHRPMLLDTCFMEQFDNPMTQHPCLKRVGNSSLLSFCNCQLMELQIHHHEFNKLLSRLFEYSKKVTQA